MTTVADIARAYQTDTDSPYHKVRFCTRNFYNKICGRLIADHGNEKLADIKARDLKRWHDLWTVNGKIVMAHSLMGMMRTLVNFGATYMEDPECVRLAAALHNLRFPQGKPRNEAITAEQVTAVCEEARRRGLHSIAIAQALQFELILRQKDVIGEWVPLSEPGTSDIIHEGEKWLRGVRWSEIDRNLILRHITSKRQKEIEVDLKNAPMVLQEFARLPDNTPPGAIVICEKTGLPWRANEFRRKWRLIATAAGVPKTVRNMDSRAGAITEATNAGADLEHVRHAATHGDIAMTQRYSRGSVEKVADVQAKRLEHRKRA